MTPRSARLRNMTERGRILPAGLLLFGALASLPGCNRKDKPMVVSERLAEQALLDRILDAADEKSRGEALRIHGPVRPNELPQIAQRSREASPTVQRNAVWLLKTARGAEAEQILRQRLADTADPVVFAKAFDGLRSAPDAKALAESRKELIAAALASENPEVHAAALRAAVLIGGPEVPALLGAALAHPQQLVRETAVELIAQRGNGAAHEAQLRALLLGKERLPLSDYTHLYVILTQSLDPNTAGAIKHSLKKPRPHEFLEFSNALFLGKSRQLWLRDLLFELLEEEGEIAQIAFSRLAGFGQDSGWGPAVHPTLVKRCLKSLEKAPPEGSPERQRYLVDLDPCREFLGHLAGRGSFTPQEATAAIEFARSFLKTAAGP